LLALDRDRRIDPTLAAFYFRFVGAEAGTDLVSLQVPF